MKHLKRILCLILTVALCAGFLIPAYASDVPTYSSSDQAVDLIERYEGFTATVSGGYIGFGSNYADCVAMYGNVSTITREQARALTLSELESTESILNSFLVRNSIYINQNQFDALIDFSYNVGVGWTVSDCYLKQLLLAGSSSWTYDNIHSAFGSWCKANGVVLQGLVNRRSEEADLFLSGSSASGDVWTGTGFRDVSEDAWYYEYVTWAAELGLVNGMGNGIFAPEADLTRAQMVQLLANFSGADLSAYHYQVFNDVSADAWYGPCIAWAYECGYINGVGGGAFAPDALISRQDLCTILMRYMESCGYYAGAQVTTYADDYRIADYAKEAVYYCSYMGLVQGIGNNTFSPCAAATRAEAATIMCRMYSVFH